MTQGSLNAGSSSCLSDSTEVDVENGLLSWHKKWERENVEDIDLVDDDQGDT